MTAYELYVKALETLFQIDNAHPEFVRIEKEVEDFVSEAEKLKETLDREEALVTILDKSEESDIESNYSDQDATTWQSTLCLRCSENGRTTRGKPRPQLQSFGGPGCRLCDKRYVTACKMEGWTPTEANDEESALGAAGTPGGPAKLN